MGTYNNEAAEFKWKFRHSIIFSFAKIYWKHNENNYILDCTNPSFYENSRHTDVYRAEVQDFVATGAAITTFCGEYNTDKIISNNLGNHLHVKKGIFVEQKNSPLNNFSVIVNAYAYDYSNFGWKI